MGNQCGLNFSDTIIIIKPVVSTGIVKIKNIQQPFIYPSPSTGRINILSVDVEALELYDCMGTVLKTTNVNPPLDSVIFDCTELKSGVYILLIQTTLGSYLENSLKLTPIFSVQTDPLISVQIDPPILVITGCIFQFFLSVFLYFM